MNPKAFVNRESLEHIVGAQSFKIQKESKRPIRNWKRWSKSQVCHQLKNANWFNNKLKFLLSLKNALGKLPFPRLAGFSESAPMQKLQTLLGTAPLLPLAKCFCMQGAGANILYCSFVCRSSKTSAEWCWSSETCLFLTLALSEGSYFYLLAAENWLAERAAASPSSESDESEDEEEEDELEEDLKLQLNSSLA